MNAHSRNPTPIRRNGFSLVEITMALGVLSFSLVAIMGLISASLGNNRDGNDDTLVAEMSTNLLNTVRNLDLPQGASTVDVFFDRSGKRLNTVDSGTIQPMTTATAAANGAIYACSLEITPDAATANADGSANLWLISLGFRWPADAANPPNHQAVHAEIAAY